MQVFPQTVKPAAFSMAYSDVVKEECGQGEWQAGDCCLSLLEVVESPAPGDPGFPVKFVGVDALYATFLRESRTRGRI
jgi:hypothetical protein